MKDHLIIITRYPEPGATKTRLIPALGAEGAAELQRKMTEHTVRTARELRKLRNVIITIFYTGADRSEMENWLGNDLDYYDQSTGDLGDRLNQAFANSFNNAADHSIVIGIDSPDITADIINSAFALLSEADVVAGPANDGGFYMLGIKKNRPELLENINWGQSNVLESLIANAKNLELNIKKTRELNDIDLPEDLPVWQRHATDTEAPKISVIIPTMNESESITATIDSALNGQNIEIIVVDCGSTDNTTGLAEQSGATVLRSDKGRAKQMNHGAANAQGELLLFLHADTLLPPAYDLIARSILTSEKVMAGAFQLKITPCSRATNTIEWLVRVRSSWLNFPYGDQAIFVKRKTFDDIGCYKEIPIMEDYDMIRKLKQKGEILISSQPIMTSNRRWEKIGPIKTTLINQMIIAGFLLGIDPEKLAALYRRKK